MKEQKLYEVSIEKLENEYKINFTIPESVVEDRRLMHKMFTDDMFMTITRGQLDIKIKNGILTKKEAAEKYKNIHRTRL